MKPTPGRIVHYVSITGQHPGEHRPAMVGRVFSDTCVNLHIMTEDPAAPVRIETSRVLDESPTPQQGTWHWPERE